MKLNITLKMNLIKKLMKIFLKKFIFIFDMFIHIKLFKLLNKDFSINWAN